MAEGAHGQTADDRWGRRHVTTRLSPRSETILNRFPACFDLADPDKTFAAIVAGLASELDVATSSVGRIRRNHRISDVDNEWDLLSLAALHDIDEGHYDVLNRRLDAITISGGVLLADPGNAGLATDTRTLLADLVAVMGDVFPSFTDEPDETLANQRLANALTRATRYAPAVALRRAQTLDAIGLHHAGNSSVESLLRATASLLALDVIDVLHHPERYWHFAICSDRIRLSEPQPAEAAAPSEELQPVADLVALEENPYKAADVNPVPRPHGQLFSITRAGWEDVPLTVRVLGVADRSMAPMVVNVDTGSGVIYTGAVADGEELRFETTGRVTLGPVDAPNPSEVTRLAFSFSGAVFAASPAHSNDFVWADADDSTVGGDRAAAFAETTPLERGFDPSTAFPHEGGLIQAPTLLVNTTRWAFFVRVSHFGRQLAPTVPEPALPTVLAGIWDESVFDPTGPDGTRAPSGQVGFEWEEREAFAVCVWLPRRFSSLDAEGSELIRERVRILLDRYRGAGIHVRVKYSDDRWTLGVGVTRDTESLDAMGTIVAGTRLWPTPEEA